jgi:formylglycine-generating enzyme required for sulfatase activity
MQQHFIAAPKAIIALAVLMLFPVFSPEILRAAGEAGSDTKSHISNSLGMTFVYVPPGTFRMGSPIDERGRSDDETLHRVTFSKGFYLQTTEVSQGQWTRVMGENPSIFDQCGENCPVENVSWDDVRVFMEKLNKMEGRNTYRLPTEAEWEYACRAGSKLDYSFDSRRADIQEYAWYDQNSDWHTNPVGQKTANAWGLFDMHGNVWEWCQGYYASYPEGPVVDPPATDVGTGRVRRGGGWGDGSRCLRCANRGWAMHQEESREWGFRLVMTP